MGGGDTFYAHLVIIFFTSLVSLLSFCVSDRRTELIYFLPGSPDPVFRISFHVLTKITFEF